MSQSGRETLPEVREWFEGPTGGPGMVGGPPEGFKVVSSPSRRSWSGRGVLPVVREWSVGPP